MSEKRIPIDSLQLESDVQVRPIYDDLVQEYADALDNGATFPPIKVFDINGTLIVVDGYHRVHAHRACGLAEIEALVTAGNHRNAEWAALGANTVNGQRLTNREKRIVAERALRLNPNMSNRAIAKHVGVSYTMVGGLRNSLGIADAPQSAPSDDAFTDDTPRPTRTGSDGKEYPAKPRRIDTDAQPSIIVDQLGTAIHDAKIAAAFEDRRKLGALAKQIEQVQGVLEEMRADPVCKQLDVGSVQTRLDGAAEAIVESLPYAICPGDCDNPEWRARGWVTKLQWEQLPKNVRE